MYKHCIKRALDIVLSALALIVLAIPMLVLAIIIKLDSPGPVLFKQKRIGIHKTYFMMAKFRTMYTETPANMPTHLLNDPERWITRSGRWMRKLSLDELPQIAHIFMPKMSIIGPRPALWNQDDLVAERDKYGANDIRPGLTGWAQINGRDALEILDKARFDGDYVENISFKMDWKCFWGTVRAVLKRDGVVEGGTGEMEKEVTEKEKEAVGK